MTLSKLNEITEEMLKFGVNPEQDVRVNIRITSATGESWLLGSVDDVYNAQDKTIIIDSLN